MTVAMDSSQSPFVRQLASSDRRTRDKALDSLRSYLRQKTQIEELELLKLWKGLFYCMWMSDKPRIQQQLARDLGGLVALVPKTMTVPFLKAFWTTMAREWVGVDVLRMDKFLYLVRIYLRSGFQYFADLGWKDEERLTQYLEVLSEIPLNSRDPKIPNGMRYHVIDIYIDELEEVMEDEESAWPLETLLKPLRSLGKYAITKQVRSRVKEALEDERVRGWLGEDLSTTEDTAKPVGDEELGGIEE